MIETTPPSELQRRLDAVQQRLRDAEIDVLVVSQAVDLFWLSGSIASGWMVIPAEGAPQLHLHRALERTALETCWTDIRRTLSSRELCATEPLASAGRVALELDVLPAAEYLKLASSLPAAKLVEGSKLLRAARSVKSPWEIERVYAAARQVEDAMRIVMPQVEVGMREIDVAIELEYQLRRHGHQGAMRMRRYNGEMFYGQVLAGENAALASYLDSPLGGSGLYPAVGKGASRRQLRDGDLLVLDMMGACDGYLSDCTRVVAIGETEPELVAAQAWCVEVLEEVSRHARPGVSGAELYQLALDQAAEAGYADRFMGAGRDQARFVGHGIGLEVDEPPFLARGFDDPLEVGMVFALEPKLVYPGRAAVGIEDAFVVTETGVDVLPAVPRDTFKAGSAQPAT